jgi:RNA polymerase sigma-70 factor (ECF subfamily)
VTNLGVGRLSDADSRNDLRNDVQGAWVRYVDMMEPHRADLYRFCRRITDDVWDAEDLVQDALLKAFGRLGLSDEGIRNPRAYLLRTAANQWTDLIRRRNTERNARGLAEPKILEASPSADRLADAASVLFDQLTPQERAAVVLKDALDLTLSEIADILGTTTGAVKSALHRGRTRLLERESMPTRRPTPPPHDLVEQFVAAFNAGDLSALSNLLLETAGVEVLGIGVVHGRDALASRDGWLQAALFGHEPWAIDQQKADTAQRAELLDFQGEPIVALWRQGTGTKAIEEFWRFQDQDGRITLIRDYCLCPETLAEVATSFDLPYRTRGYRLSDQVLQWVQQAMKRPRGDE